MSKTLDTVLGRLEKVTADLAQAKQVSQTNSPGTSPVLTDVADLSVSTKAAELKHGNASSGYQNDGSKSASAAEVTSALFARLASKGGKQFKELGASRTLDNPMEYLRATTGKTGKDGEVEHVVTGKQLERILSAGLLAGSQDNGDAQGTEVYRYGRDFVGQMRENGVISKALDTTTGAALIRQDLSPVLQEAFLRKFPAYDRIRKTPANGLIHLWPKRTDPGPATTTNDAGDFSGGFTNSTFSRANTSHIATVTSPRNITLKLTYANEQGGVKFGLDANGETNLEVIGGIYAIAKKVQSLMFQGNYSTATDPATSAAPLVSTEYGVFDGNGFDGLRTILSPSGTSINKVGGETYVYTLSKAISDLIDAGVDEENITAFMRVKTNTLINNEINAVYRVLNGAPATGYDGNLSGKGFMFIDNYKLDVFPVPAATTIAGEGIGFYNVASVATEDIYVLDINELLLAYLGSPEPMVLELPVGYNNSLSQVYVPFLMAGMGVSRQEFCRKVRVPKSV